MYGGITIKNQDLHKYKVIAQKIEQEIFLQKYVPNYPLPSIRKYAQKYNVAPATVSRALLVLEQREIIYNLRTSRYRISKNIEQKRQEIAKQETFNLLKKLHGLGFTDNEIMQMIIKH